MSLRVPILITGAAGFVGSNLLRRLVADVDPKKVHVTLRKSSDCWRIADLLKKVSVHTVDLRKTREVERLVKSIKPKTIFHLATHGAYPRDQYDEEEILDTNVLSTFNLIRSSLAAGFSAFVNTGSSSEYGPKQKPMRESDVVEPVTAYGASKAWATLYGQYLARTQKAPIVTLRPFQVYGYYEPRGRLVPNLILSLEKGERPRLASPRIARDWVFIDDMVRAYLLAAGRPTAGTVFNIATGKQATLKEVFEIVRDALGVRVEPIWDAARARSFDTSRWVADTKFTKNHLGWRSNITLREGLRRTVRWFRKNLHRYEK